MDFLKKKGVCTVCGKPTSHTWDVACSESCAKSLCSQGKHTWDPVALGPGIASFECLYCDATSEGTLQPLERFGFVEIKPDGDD